MLGFLADCRDVHVTNVNIIVPSRLKVQKLHLCIHIHFTFIPDYIQGAPPQYDVPPPKYEEVVSNARTSNMPQIQPSARRPVMSKTITRNRP